MVGPGQCLGTFWSGEAVPYGFLKDTDMKHEVIKEKIHKLLFSFAFKSVKLSLCNEKSFLS
jgi:hypothetical protein